MQVPIEVGYADGVGQHWVQGMGGPGQDYRYHSIFSRVRVLAAAAEGSLDRDGESIALKLVEPLTFTVARLVDTHRGTTEREEVTIDGQVPLHFSTYSLTAEWKSREPEPVLRAELVRASAREAIATSRTLRSLAGLPASLANIVLGYVYVESRYTSHRFSRW